MTDILDFRITAASISRRFCSTSLVIIATSLVIIQIPFFSFLYLYSLHIFTEPFPIHHYYCNGLSLAGRIVLLLKVMHYYSFVHENGLMANTQRKLLIFIRHYYHVRAFITFLRKLDRVAVESFAFFVLLICRVFNLAVKIFLNGN